MVRLKKPMRRVSCILLAIIILMSMIVLNGENVFVNAATISTGRNVSEFGTLFDTAEQFIVVKHKQLGGSHYAYTDLLSDEKNTIHNGESTDNFNADARGSQMVLLTADRSSENNVQFIETVLLETTAGIIRDPDVSEDGTRVVYSYKADYTDDCHLYEMEIATKKVTQLTFGTGISDSEPKYLAGGKIVFSSSRCVETVDCWVIPVMNMYICNGDGTNIQRLGYDQVHTTYPTVTSDGRILYTRWDYNDRNQMYIQSVFQMFADGTNQTEVFGNNSNFPTTLLHTREIPGSPGVYISIASGHHNHQKGKPVIIDTNKGRNNKTNEGDLTNAISYLFPGESGNARQTTMSEDTQNQGGAQYKYPYALNINEYLISYTPSHNNGRNTQYGIYYMNTQTDTRIKICDGSTTYGGASQIVPIKTRVLFERPSMVNHAVDTGTYYIGNIYEGDGLKDLSKTTDNTIAIGEAKYLRVVALEFRSSAIGATQANGVDSKYRDTEYGSDQNNVMLGTTGTADPFSPVSTGNGSWDVKRVLGIVDIEEDGSVMFKVPANTPVYFQVLNEDGEMLQSMRSWSTLMPNEVFSCVGCHEDKNTVPPVAATTTMAMSKGVQELKPDLWMKEDPSYDAGEDSTGFSYTEVIQPILDNNCISCHNNIEDAESAIGKNTMVEGDGITADATALLPLNSTFQYYTNSMYGTSWTTSTVSWASGRAPFGTNNTPPGDSIATNWNSQYLYLRANMNVSSTIYNDRNNYDFYLRIAYDENPTLYLNGTKVFETGSSQYVSNYTDIRLSSSFRSALKSGENIVALSGTQSSGGQFMNFAIYAVPSSGGSDNRLNPISLESTPVEGDREKIYYPLSYLVLTASKPAGSNFLGDPTNKYTSWISCMSQSEMLKPKQYGSTQSAIIQKLKEGHCSTITEEEIQAISAWIDLAVPLRSDYDELKRWNSNEYREYEEKYNKRQNNDIVDEVTKRISSGVYESDKKEIKIEYLNGNTVVGSATGKGMAILNLASALTQNRKVRITLPEGEEYLAFNLHKRLAEAVIYCPGGVYEYTIPATTMMTRIFPSFVREDSKPIITARIASEADLKKVTNLAVNPYDVTTAASSTYPHAVASNTFSTTGEFDARNAIDGFKNNLGHGNYPVQSWGPVQNPPSTMTYKVDFGNVVYVNSIGITIRFDKSGNHDTYYTGATLEFSDGTTQNITLKDTADAQIISLDSVKSTSSVTIKNFKTATSTWASLSEVEVFGSVLPQQEIPVTDFTLSNSTMSLVEGLTGELSVISYTPSDATNKAVTWDSLNKSVATVDANGNIKAVSQGTATITAKIGDVVKQCVVTVIKKEIESISINKNPAKTSYLVGETFSASGMEVKITYNDKTTAVVTTGFTLSAPGMNTTGTKTVTVTYSGKTTSFNITVKSLSSISINKNPTTTIYNVNDTFSSSGLEIKLNYSDGTSEIKTTGFTLSAPGMNTTGTKTVTVTYSGKTATFNITVRSLSSISVSKNPTKTVYTVGETLNTSGMQLKLTYNDNSTETVPSGWTASPTALNTIGTQRITITYKGKTTTLNVTVQSAVPSYITSSRYTVNNTNNYLSKIPQNTTVTTLLAGINERNYVKVYSGSTQITGSRVVGTGMTVRLMDGSTVKRTYTIIVTGDVNGDGDITITDMINVKSHILKKSTITGVKARAGDTNGDGDISITDFIQIKAYILKKGSITAR